MTPEIALRDRLSEVHDPRRQKSIEYPLHEILFISVCAMLSGAEAFTEFEEFGLTRREWLKKHLELAKGIPSHDTFRAVYSLIRPNQFNEFFIDWSRDLCRPEGEDLIAIDGKSLKGSSKDQAVHIVNVWASTNNLVLGQIQTETKSNEITAIPKLLEQLAIKGATITIDAMGTQREIAKTIDDAGAIYVLSLKRNHPDLYDDVQTYMDDPDPGAPMDYYEETDGGEHGRVEIRRHWITSHVSWLDKEWKWAGLTAFGKVERHREPTGKAASIETAYYLCSIAPEARTFAKCVRNHWGVENRVHWVLDMIFNEDACQVHDKNAAANLSLLRKLTLNLLRLDESKGSLRLKRKKAGWDIEFLEKLLNLTHA